MKKWMIGVLSSIIIIPMLAMSWKNIQSVWATPEKLTSVEKKVDKHEDSQEKLSTLVMEQQARIDKNEAVQQAHLDALKGQLELIAQLKNKK